MLDDTCCEERIVARTAVSCRGLKDMPQIARDDDLVSRFAFDRLDRLRVARVHECSGGRADRGDIA